METESAFIERFMLIVINRSYWSVKEVGQTGVETCWKRKKINQGMGTGNAIKFGCYSVFCQVNFAFLLCWAIASTYKHMLGFSNGTL